MAFEIINLLTYTSCFMHQQFLSLQHKHHKTASKKPTMHCRVLKPQKDKHQTAINWQIHKQPA